MKRIGYIGLGIMGLPMARNLLKAGFELVVHNRTRAKADPLLELGAEWADSPAQVSAQVQAVCINVTDTPDVEQVIFAKHGIVEGNPGDTAGLIIIDHSTISPQVTRAFASRLLDYDIHLLDAPVSGGDVGAQNGTLSIMVGGEPDIFSQALPIFQAVGKSITHLGPSGSGQACKACNQILCALNLLATSEAIALAHRENLDPMKMIQVTSAGAASSWQLANLGPKIAQKDWKPGFMIDLLLKDLHIVRDEARRHGLPLAATDLAANYFASASSHGFGQLGTQAVSRIVNLLASIDPQSA